MSSPPRLPRRSMLRMVTVSFVALVVGGNEPGGEEEPGTPPDAPPPAPPDAPPSALLDGVLLDPEAAVAVNDRLPVAVMMDNNPRARPQIGLDRADLVYEMVVEGGITRFMAVFLRQDASWVEPVRSARTPFLYIARELGAVIAHVGAAGTDGPADTDTQFGRWGVRHLDEQHNPGPFWRDRTRVAPHNAVTDTVQIRGHAAGLSWLGPSGTEPWLYKDDLTIANALSGVIGHASYRFAVGRIAPLYDFAVDWYYDPEINGYRRWMAGRPHADGHTGEVLSARNVVVQLDNARVVDREGHVLYGSLGGGQAYVFLDGQMIEATWSKATNEERTRYWDANGEEIRFNRGNTWVTVLPIGSPLAWE